MSTIPDFMIGGCVHKVALGQKGFETAGDQCTGLTERKDLLDLMNASLSPDAFLKTDVAPAQDLPN
jgi:hypothetical protein